MSSRARSILLAAGIPLVLVLLPLGGVMLAGRSPADYLQFPPRTREAAHAAFSWPVFAGMALLIMLTVAPFVIRTRRARHRLRAPAPRPVAAFPWWGWAGLAFGAAAWVMAWMRFAWFEPLQRFTFSPLWLAYILVVNALTFRRSGRCMLRDRPVYFLALFPVSAVFWWYFEYLNRFVQNWHYEGIGAMGAAAYVLMATLPFATVLPAVLGTAEFLAADPRTGAGLDEGPRLHGKHPRAAAGIALGLAAAGTAALGLLPDLLFPLLWVSPLVVLLALRALLGHRTLLDEWREGRWRRTYILGLAALVCGFFWELWNAGSAARWVYLVPYVNRFHLFEMPLLGYAGYLPFGLECAVIGDLVAALVNDNRG